MSTKPNHRRGEGRKQDNGPRFERGGSDDTHVARSRRKWKRRAARSERRTGQVTPKVRPWRGKHGPLPVE
jgi:hypothetical protein